MTAMNSTICLFVPDQTSLLRISPSSSESKPHLLSRVATLALGETIGGFAAEFTDVPEPAISLNEILVKVRAVALNPTDHMHIDAILPPGSIIGCDYAGDILKNINGKLIPLLQPPKPKYPGVDSAAS